MSLPTTEEEMKKITDAAIREATGGLRGELQAERDKRSEFEKKLDTIQVDLDAAKAKEAEAEALKAKDDLEGKGKYDEALKKAEEAYETKLAELTSGIEKSNAKISELMIDGKILALAENAVNPEQAVVLIKQAHKFEIKDGQVVVQKVDGTPLLDKDGHAATVEGTYNQFMELNLHLMKPGTTLGGSETKPGETRLTGGNGNADLLKQINEAQKAGNTALVFKLKNKMQTAQGPHSLE